MVADALHVEFGVKHALVADLAANKYLLAEGVGTLANVQTQALMSKLR